MVGGAWPFLVGGVICLVNSVNERDLGVLTRGRYHCVAACSFLDGLRASSPRKLQAITGLRCP